MVEMCGRVIYFGPAGFSRRFYPEHFEREGCFRNFGLKRWNRDCNHGAIQEECSVLFRHKGTELARQFNLAVREEAKIFLLKTLKERWTL